MIHTIQKGFSIGITAFMVGGWVGWLSPAADPIVTNATYVTNQITTIIEVVNDRSSLFATITDKARVLDGLQGAQSNVQILKDMAAKNDAQSAWFLQKVADTLGTIGDDLKKGVDVDRRVAAIFAEGGIDGGTSDTRGTTTVITSALFPLIVARQIFVDVALAVSRIPKPLVPLVAPSTNPVVVPAVVSPAIEVQSPIILKKKKNKFSPAMIAGITVGSVVAAAAIGLTAWGVASYHKKKKIVASSGATKREAEGLLLLGAAAPTPPQPSRLSALDRASSTNLLPVINPKAPVQRPRVLRAAAAAPKPAEQPVLDPALTSEDDDGSPRSQASSDSRRPRADRSSLPPLPPTPVLSPLPSATAGDPHLPSATAGDQMPPLELNSTSGGLSAKKGATLGVLGTIVFAACVNALKS